jgi:hypothetical protein
MYINNIGNIFIVFWVLFGMSLLANRYGDTELSGNLQFQK